MSCVTVRRSSDQSTQADADAQHAAAHLSNNTTHSSQGESSRPSGQSSRPSSRQGQKYTATATATADADASTVVTGYHDSVLPNRKVNLTLQYLSI